MPERERIMGEPQSLGASFAFVPERGTAFLMPDDQNFDLLSLDAVEQLVGETVEESDATAFGCRRPVFRIALDAGDDRQELIEELAAKSLGRTLVVAPCIFEVFLDQGMIDHFHRLRLSMKASISS